jgi:hypothetical protein
MDNEKNPSPDESLYERPGALAPLFALRWSAEPRGHGKTTPENGHMGSDTPHRNIVFFSKNDGFTWFTKKLLFCFILNDFFILAAMVIQ